MSEAELAWAGISTALVLLMTPGLAFFYGGLVKAKSVVSMMMMSFGALALVSGLWVLYGYSMTVESTPTQFSGNPLTHFGMTSLNNDELVAGAFAATFAIITTALISGAIADRARFGSWMVFAGVWATVVYFPSASWVWGGGWIQTLGDLLGGFPAVIDYAGGTVVEISSGASALALALVLGQRVVFEKGADKPHNVPLVLLGAGLLWFGWIGFNAGAEFANGLQNIGLIIVNTMASSAFAVLGFLVVERMREGKATSVGAASGAIAGLVAITPACANLTPGASLFLGVIAGVASALAIEWKFQLGYDDSLDVVAIHLLSGLIGMIFLGFFANDTGWFMGGDYKQLVVQLIASIAMLVYAFVAAFVIGWVIQKLGGFRVSNADEIAGIDLMMHGEEGYSMERY